MSAEVASLEAVLDELRRRSGLAAAPAGGRAARWKEYYDSLLPQQRRLCETTARWVAALTPRRGSKSTAAQALLLDAGERYPRTAVYYIHPGGGTQAVETMMGPDINLERTAEMYGLPWRWNANLRTLFHQKTRTEIRIRGADDMAEVKKVRGHKVSLGVVDEAQNFPPHLLRHLIDEDLGPSLTDCRGKLYVLGTPGEICRVGDPWYDITRNEDAESRAKRDALWEVHEWLALDNPYVSVQIAEEVALKLAILGGGGEAELRRLLLSGIPADREHVLQLALALKSMAIVRERFGRWVHDTEGLVYSFDAKRNTYDGTLPRGHVWAYFQGGDLGTNDSYADVVWAAAKTHPIIYEVDGSKVPGLNADQWRERYETRRKHWNPKRCMLDEGGLGKGVGDAWRAAGIPVEAAEKTQKLAFIALVNAKLEAGRVKVRSASPLAAEWVALRKATDARPGVYAVVGDDHSADAGLYGIRPALDYCGEVDAPAKEETFEERRERREIEELQRENAKRQELQRTLTSKLPGVRVTR